MVFFLINTFCHAPWATVLPQEKFPLWPMRCLALGCVPSPLYAKELHFSNLKMKDYLSKHIFRHLAFLGNTFSKINFSHFVRKLICVYACNSFLISLFVCRFGVCVVHRQTSNDGQLCFMHSEKKNTCHLFPVTFSPVCFKIRLLGKYISTGTMWFFIWTFSFFLRIKCLALTSVNKEGTAMGTLCWWSCVTQINHVKISGLQSCLQAPGHCRNGPFCLSGGYKLLSHLLSFLQMLDSALGKNTQEELHKAFFAVFFPMYFLFLFSHNFYFGMGWFNLFLFIVVINMLHTKMSIAFLWRC